MRGLYVITDHALSLQHHQALVDMAEAAIHGGARIVQYRNKTSPQAQRQRDAQALAELCKKQEVLFLINDDVQLACSVDADGVHLGQSDTNMAG